MPFTRGELLSFRGQTLPDLLGPDVRLLFVGINPGLLTVAVQSHFGRRGNRFYPALHRAGSSTTSSMPLTGSIRPTSAI
jgi:TDG/mug DNA glycosylase family protein